MIKGLSTSFEANDSVNLRFHTVVAVLFAQHIQSACTVLTSSHVRVKIFDVEKR